MIKFRQKEFTEYDAMRSLYVKLMRYSDRNKFGVIDTSALIPVLRGNNVVIERFVISTSMFGEDKYRMYLKIGAKAKLPDEVRLPGKTYDKRLGNMQLNVSHSIFAPKDSDPNWNNNNNGGNNNTSLGDTSGPRNDNPEERRGGKKKEKKYSEFPGSILEQREFKSKGGDKQYPYLSGSFSPSFDLSYEVSELLGEAIKYDKKSRSLVLEFKSIEDAINALNILPFGLGYKIYLLNA